MTYSRLHAVTCVWGLLLVAAWILINEQPTLGTQGSWPPGVCVTLIPMDAISTAVHRGWPYSFYCSYVVQGDAVAQYFDFSAWWNAMVLLAVLAPTSLGIEFALRRRARAMSS